MARTVTVCDACLTACCWLGVEMCSEAMNSSTVEMSLEQLQELGYEHPSYWDEET